MDQQGEISLTYLNLQRNHYKLKSLTKNLKIKRKQLRSQRNLYIQETRCLIAQDKIQIYRGNALFSSFKLSNLSLSFFFDHAQCTRGTPLLKTLKQKQLHYERNLKKTVKRNRLKLPKKTRHCLVGFDHLSLSINISYVYIIKTNLSQNVPYPR